MQGLGEVTEKLRRSTVQITAGRNGTGSGVVWSAGGAVLTNNHVARSPRVRLQLWDGSMAEANVLKRHPGRDLALLQAEASGLIPAHLGDSSQVRPGQLVVAVGNPLGFSGAASTGIVHGVGPVHGLGNATWLQADVRLAPGNSGGPLADSEGRVVGLNTMVVSGRLGLAIPVEDIVRFVNQPAPPRLGVTVQQVRLSSGGCGLLLLDVEENSPAGRASLRPGDVVIGAGRGRLESIHDLSHVLENTQDVVRLQFLRQNHSSPRYVSIALGNSFR
jgi:serine protease Do